MILIFNWLLGILTEKDRILHLPFVVTWIEFELEDLEVLHICITVSQSVHFLSYILVNYLGIVRGHSGVCVPHHLADNFKGDSVGYGNSGCKCESCRVETYPLVNST